MAGVVFDIMRASTKAEPIAIQRGPSSYEEKHFSSALIAFSLSGCASLISSATSGFTDNLSASMLDQDDPETAKAALPTFMVTIDSLIRSNPDDPDLLSSGATLYAIVRCDFCRR